jgi:hypothetical protein
MPQCRVEPVINDGGGESTNVGVRHVVIGETELDGVGTGEWCAGQPCVKASQLWRTGQQIGSADVGNESDADFGHADL